MDINIWVEFFQVLACGWAEREKKWHYGIGIQGRLYEVSCETAKTTTFQIKHPSLGHSTGLLE
jgi:hypothetical protein